MSGWLQQAALWTWQNSIAAAALAAVVLGMRKVFRGKIAARWLCLAGWLVMLRLFLPAPLPHAWAWDRAWAGPAPLVKTAKGSAIVEHGTVAVDGAAPSLAQLREEIATVRASLDELTASGLGLGHPKVLSVSTELTAREQALATLPLSLPAAAGAKVDWFAITIQAWVAGALGFMVSVFIRHWRFTRRLARSSEPVTLPWAGLTEECAAAAGLRRAPRLFTIPGGGTPFLCGLLRPRIVIPADTLAILTPAEARHVMLHEMLHIKRRDLLANWLLAAVRALHWFNPFIHAVCRRLLADRELLRDAQAIALLRDPGQRSAYGHTLLKLALPLSTPVPSPGLAPLFHSEKELQRRLTMIQSPLRHRRLAACAAIGALAVISAPLFTTARGSDKTKPEKVTEAPPVALEAPAPPSVPALPVANESRGKEVNELEGQLSALRELDDEQLVAGALALGATDPTLAKVYSDYQNETFTLGILAKSGFGPKHPKTLGLKESTRLRLQQLKVAAENYRRGLPIRIAAAKAGTATGEEVPATKSTSPAAEGSTARGASIENLRAVAAKLRENGQTEEAEAIEKELKNLSVDFVPTPVPSGFAPVPAGEVQQLRAEMAEIKAALAGLQVKRVTELSQDLEQVETEMNTLLNAGLGLKHPRILMLAGKMAAIQKQVESPKAPLAATGFYEDMLERDVAKLKTQWEFLSNLKGEQLIAAFMDLGLQNATIQKLYPEYQSDLAALGSATKSGFGATHPKVKALRESTRTKFAQLEAAVENYRKSMKVQIDSSQKMLADARKRDAEQVRAVKGEAVSPLEAPPRKVLDPKSADTEAGDVEKLKSGADAHDDGEKLKGNPDKVEAVGEVIMVNSDGGFVLLRGRNGVTLDDGQELLCEGSGAGRLKVTSERKSNMFFAADIVSGTPEKGDSVIRVKGRGKPAPKRVP